MTLEVRLPFDDVGLKDDMTMRQGVKGHLRCLR